MMKSRLRNVYRSVRKSTERAVFGLFPDLRSLLSLRMAIRGYRRGRSLPWTRVAIVPRGNANPLRSYFDSRREGPGIWKWNHYFDVYHRHFQKFIGKEVHVVEIGVYSGGSLEMWKQYFGAKSRIYGVDIEPACKSYEDEVTRIFVGNQADRNFWCRFRADVPKVDVVIDDGGHSPEQQIATLEEILPHMQPGGVYLCEDVHGSDNPFAWYVGGFCANLHEASQWSQDVDTPERRIRCVPIELSRAIESVHFYPFLTLIEKRTTDLPEMVAPKHGTQWQPFLK
jgi:hypothetical protein